MEEQGWIVGLSITSSIASLILAVVAIWLSWLFFRKASDDSRNTELAVAKIDEATSTLSKLSMRIIGRLTTALVDSNQPTSTDILSLMNKAEDGGSLKDIEDKSSPINKQDLEQFRIDNLIAALYYSGVSNLALQFKLPNTIGETSSGEHEGIANLVDQSYADFQTLTGWINGAQNSDSKIKKSPVQHLYTQALGITPQIRSVREYYAELEKV